jgi:hypothetical protein
MIFAHANVTRVAWAVPDDLREHLLGEYQVGSAGPGLTKPELEQVIDLRMRCGAAQSWAEWLAKTRDVGATVRGQLAGDDAIMLVQNLCLEIRRAARPAEHYHRVRVLGRCSQMTIDHASRIFLRTFEKLNDAARDTNASLIG